MKTIDIITMSMNCKETRTVVDTISESDLENIKNEFIKNKKYSVRIIYNTMPFTKQYPLSSLDSNIKQIKDILIALNADIHVGNSSHNWMATNKLILAVANKED